MLVKIGDLIINTDTILYVNLSHCDNYDETKQDGVEICFIPVSRTKYFYGEEAEILRWYFNHPTSDVVDIKGLKG